MIFKKRKLALLLAISLVLTGIPFPGNTTVVNATEVQEEVQETTPEETPAEESVEVVNYIVDTNFNEATLNKNLTELSGTNWTGGCNEGSYAGYSKVVAKNTIGGFANADVNDYCIEFTLEFP